MYHKMPTVQIIVTIIISVLALNVMSGEVKADDVKTVERGLLGWWKFDDGSGGEAIDSSGIGNSGDITGAEWVEGKFGRALHFGGKNAYVSVQDLEGLDESSEMTAEVWVYWEGTGKYPNIITGGNWNPGGFLMFVADNQCSFRMFKPGPAPWEPKNHAECSAAILQFKQGQWYHLAVTCKRPTMRTYVNGQPAGTADWDYPVGFSGDLRIGAWDGNGVCHNGLIDEVKIYNRALTESEIKTSYAKEANKRTEVQVSGSKPYTKLVTSVKPAITLKNRYTTLMLDKKTRVIGLVDRSTGKDIHNGDQPLVTVRAGGKEYKPSSCSYCDGKLMVDFGKSGINAVIKFDAIKGYYRAEVLSVTGSNLEKIVFMNFGVEPAKYVSGTSGLAADDEFGVCIRALTVATEVSIGGRPPRLQAFGLKRPGLIGLKAALVASPIVAMRTTLQELVRREGVPYSTLGGPFAQDAEENRGSYIFANISEANADEWIALTKRAGFTDIHFNQGWEKTLGHYEPRKDWYPNGLAGMKAIVKKIHDAGLKAGIHTLTGCIDTRDAWVTPVPDKRLAADASYTLAADMDEKSDTILTVEKPGNHDIVWTYASNGNVIRIGEELIHYSAISQEPPYGFTKCTRGAFHTKPGSHSKGAAADHLRHIYLAFYPDPFSTLVGEVADAIANVFNTGEFDEIYMDGSEGMGSNYAIGVMRDAIYKRLKRPAQIEASCWDHWSWYYHSRIGAWDHPCWGLNRFVDRHIADIPTYRQSALLGAQLGWWAIRGPSDQAHGGMPEEMEYYCGKTFAWDAPISVQGVDVGPRPWNARQNEYFTTFGRYERLRLANYFTPEVKARLREPGREFRLKQAESGFWQFVPTDYVDHRVTGLPDGSK
ncbi:MAG: hypothetical protein PHR77_07035 [Kiritimatiellae bacterium]|nr:hypothetical protein [Kiritimatiellia bacterium]